MAAEPTQAELHELDEFLRNCEWAAAPPIRNALLPVSLLDGLRQAQTFGDVGTMKQGPVAADERLPETRVERIAKLKQWMSLFPAYRWLNDHPIVNGAQTSFRRIQARKRNNERLTNDTAEFRFWHCVTWAALIREYKPLPSPDYEQRSRAAKLARQLCTILNSTSLMKDVGMDWRRRSELLEALRGVQAIEAVTRRPRSDAFTADREVVGLLTEICYNNFSDAPPTLITWLASLKMANPDKSAITKQVSAKVRELLKAAS